MITILYGGGLDALQVRAGGGFGHGDGADHFATRHFRQIVRFDVIVAIVQQVRCNDLRMQRPTQSARIALGRFLEQDDRKNIDSAPQGLIRRSSRPHRP